MQTATDLLPADGVPETASTAQTYLIVRDSDSVRVEELTLGRELIVGRANDAGLCLQDSSTSRRHVRLFWKGEQLWAEDLGSRNGTLLNGRQLTTPTSLTGGDSISIGASQLVVASTSAVAETSDPSLEISGHVVIADPAMARVFSVARRLARVSTTVLILGETGVGKEVVAEQIHAWSDRVGKPFVRVNCAAIAESLVESELFGHEKGAFTGADQRRVGHFEAADGGTLLLDEVGDLPQKVQANLLLTLENRCIIRVGASQEIPVDVRVLCATHRDLLEEANDGRFRQDLYYRLAAFTLTVPPLRERPGEIKLLAGLFAARMAATMNEPTPRLMPDAIAALERHDWPGNVRELRNAIEHAMILAEDRVLRLEHLPPALLGAKPLPELAGTMAMADELERIERRRIEEVLAAEGGNQTRAAKQLGMTRRALIYRLEKYRIGRG